MSAPVVSVTEETDAREIADLLSAHRIKRVPVVCDGKVAGVVSRADLNRAIASVGLGPAEDRRRSNSIAGLD
jgi:CBS-domain-containing membrane protein